ncbi:hypothetical protein [Paenibacillus sedimenti]|uniref:Cytosolic protein n=1 Tax=Paenibacillus sedimenti TaxID=2770274 RepID=A0A926KN16_9BACL|nr:hypothetical protein [Paenibacillus sedimenti]MBD0380118.1 hypothetical protein [Paenibacillus sedimenti]
MSKDFDEQEKKQSKGFIDEYRDEYTDLKTVESQRNDLTAEEFPDGPYGSDLITESLGKSTPWREDQRPSNTYSYENRDFHQDIPRAYPDEDDLRNEPSNEK